MAQIVNGSKVTVVTEVEETYEVDVNGILTVTARVVSTGKTKKLIVTNHSGRLSKQEMEKMIEDAEKFKIEDHEYKKRMIAYNDLEDCLYHLRNKVNGNDLPPIVLKDLKYAIDETTTWLSDNNSASCDEIEDKKEYLDISKLSISN